MVIIEITGLISNGGNVHIIIEDRKIDGKRNYEKEFVIECSNNILIYELDMPYGEYVFMVFQDTNNNGRLDSNILEIPIEPVGLSNYNGGFPGEFDRHKVLVNGKETGVSITMRNLLRR